MGCGAGSFLVEASDAAATLEVEDGAPAQPAPGHAGSSPDAAPEEAALAAPPVARSDEAVEKKKKTLRNTMHFSATWLAPSKRTRRLWRAMPCLEEPLRVHCGKRLVMQKTKGGNRELMMLLVDGGYMAELCEVSGVLRDSERMRQLKFASAEDLGSLASGEEHLIDREVADYMIRFRCELVRARLMSLMSYSHLVAREVRELAASHGRRR